MRQNKWYGTIRSIVITQFKTLRKGRENKAEALVKIILGFLLIGSLQNLVAGNIGDPTTLREITDTFSGYMYAYDGNFGSYGDVQSWSIYAGSQGLPGLDLNVTGHQITPVLLDPNGWVIIGIGATKTVKDPGLYNFNFDLVAGSDAVTPGMTFGWFDGSDTSTNQGTISFDRAATTTGYRVFNRAPFPTVGTGYTTEEDFTGPNQPNGWEGGRIYSVQFDPVAELPEPASLAMFLGGFALLAALRRR
jgi:hypothetical protein